MYIFDFFFLLAFVAKGCSLGLFFTLNPLSGDIYDNMEKWRSNPELTSFICSESISFYMVHVIYLLKGLLSILFPFSLKIIER